MFRCVVAIVILSLLCQAKKYRFDYEYSETAGGWMKYHVIPSTWEEARLRCYAEGAVLASPLNEVLKEGIVSFLRKQRESVPRTIFIGVHARFSKGDYSSIEGVPLLRLAINWSPGEPDNFDNSESCLVMYSNSAMADVRCDAVYPYVCYKAETYLTMNACGTADPEYILEPRTGSCYKFHKRGRVWSEAYMTCVAEGGHLVIIDSVEEAAVVKEIFSKHPVNTIFSRYPNSLLAGIHDWGHNANSFMTIHGKTLDEFNKWNPGNPDNFTNTRSGDSGQYCAGVYRNGLMDDIYCSVAVAFLCEKNPKSLL